MYGLQNILTEQGLSLEQQCVVLELLNSAKLLDPLSLLVSLGPCEFSPDETNRIIQAALNATYNQACKFDPRQLLSTLATEETHLKEKTKHWFDRMVKSAFIERREMIRSFITPAMLLAFTPRPPLPPSNHYDTIIVFDSATQPIMDGLDYVKLLLDTQQLKCSKILIPKTLSAMTINQNGFTSALRAHLPTYLQMNGLQSRVKQDEHLSQEQLADFLIQLHSVQQNSPQPHTSIYLTMYTLMRSNRILIVTTQDNIQITTDTVAFVHDAMRNSQLMTDVIYTLQKKELSTDDLLTLLVEQFYNDGTPGQSLTSTAADMSAAAAAAAAAAATATTPSAATPATSTKDGHTITPQDSSTGLPPLSCASLANPHAPAGHAINQQGSNSRGLIAMGLVTAGFFAYANPEATTSVATTAFEAVRELARTAVRTYMG